ncbi:hypothetical protein AVEN_138783-1 [Araneus ventricosus]|uniref:Uncharacterized protein n=1 Tax=Araneus ventricosus TaxID=182803 RepID=A0A4Y2FPM3_ARAVE|nr:hypothetical protein AVEN_138783-1 [Araneus ventricosus]
MIHRKRACQASCAELSPGAHQPICVVEAIKIAIVTHMFPVETHRENWGYYWHCYSFNDTNPLVCTGPKERRLHQEGFPPFLVVQGGMMRRKRACQASCAQLSLGAHQPICVVEAIKITIITHMPPVETQRGNAGC